MKIIEKNHDNINLQYENEKWGNSYCTSKDMFSLPQLNLSYISRYTLTYY